MVWILATVFLAIFSQLSRNALAASPEEEDLYTRVFEEVSPDVIIDNEYLVKSYVNCFVNKGPCNEHAATVKGTISEVFRTVCGDCSDQHKAIFKYSLNKFIPKYPSEWKEILTVYDPNGEYWPNIKAFMES